MSLTVFAERTACRCDLDLCSVAFQGCGQFAVTFDVLTAANGNCQSCPLLSTVQEVWVVPCLLLILIPVPSHRRDASQHDAQLIQVNGQVLVALQGAGDPFLCGQICSNAQKHSAGGTGPRDVSPGTHDQT